MHIDHVIPVSKGGLHIPENIVLACRTCNFSKHATDLDQWLATKSPAFRLRYETGQRGTSEKVTQQTFDFQEVMATGGEGFEASF